MVFIHTRKFYRGGYGDDKHEKMRVKYVNFFIMFLCRIKKYLRHLVLRKYIQNGYIIGGVLTNKTPQMNIVMVMAYPTYLEQIHVTCD